MRVVALSGSLSVRSANLALVERATELAPEGVRIDVYRNLGELPLFNPDIEDAPATVVEWRTALAGCDAVLIASPEYGHSLPGVLKNALDWTIPSGELYDKVVGYTCSVAHLTRGRNGLDALRRVLVATGAKHVGGIPTLREELDERILELIGQMRSA